MFVREDTEVSGAKDNNNNARGGDKGDSDLEEEVENDAEALIKVNNRAREESAAAFSKPKYKIVATLQYRATFSNIKKNPITYLTGERVTRASGSLLLRLY